MKRTTNLIVCHETQRATKDKGYYGLGRNDDASLTKIYTPLLIYPEDIEYVPLKKNEFPKYMEEKISIGSTNNLFIESIPNLQSKKSYSKLFSLSWS